MKKNTALVLSLWVLLVSGSFTWNYAAAEKSRETVALQTARSFFDQIVITRKWNARHGGVYAPVTEQTRPNPYLDTPAREIIVSKELTLTKVNPAYMTRQIAEIADLENGVKFHITSLLPLRPDNAPIARERTALEQFQQDKTEVGEFIDTETGTVFFYMAPLLADKECLQCHAKQGYLEGDVRGGISVTLPFQQQIPLLHLAAGHLSIGLAGFVTILLFAARLQTYTEMLQRQSVTDALTSIPNRRSFSETILLEFRRAKRERVPLSVIMCDVDRFKKYNDSYGHAAGDACLKCIANTLTETLHRPGDFCARYGGEEFVILLPNTHDQAALDVAEQIRATVQALAIRHEQSLPLQVVTLSLGVATLALDEPISDEQLVKYADDALYRAKENGRNRVECSSRELAATATRPDPP
jgi:diguanylate cyclase (GGDEF)-like protein